MAGKPSPRAVSPEQAAACPPGARLIPLTRGWVAWVDEDRFDSLGSRAWSVHVDGDRGYAVARQGGHYVLMHRLIVEAARGVDVDHREWPGEKVVDNRSSNLRICNRADNARNMRRLAHTASGLKGARPVKGKWQARIHKPGERASGSLGYYATPAEAAFAYDLAAIKHFGEFARTNYHSEFTLEQLIANGRANQAAREERTC